MHLRALFTSPKPPTPLQPCLRQARRYSPTLLPTFCQWSQTHRTGPTCLLWRCILSFILVTSRSNALWLSDFLFNLRNLHTELACALTSDTHALQMMQGAPQPGDPTKHMVQNSIDVGLEVNRLRTIPIVDIMQVMTASGSMTMDEIELVWPHVSDAGLCLCVLCV